MASKEEGPFSPSTDDLARSGKFVIGNGTAARACIREQSALALLAEVSALLQSDQDDEAALLFDLTSVLDDVGLECAVDVVDGRTRARHGARPRDERLDALIGHQSARAMNEKRPIWCCREPVTSPIGIERKKDDWALHELGAVAVDWVLSVPIEVSGRTFGALTVYARADESTFPQVALVCAIAQLVGGALARRTERASMIRAVERRETAMAIVAHDLKNPLGVILMMARLLRAGRASIDDPVTGVAAIERQATQMLALVQDILESAVMTSNEFVLKPAPCEPAALIAGAFDFVRPLAVPKQLQLTTAVADGVPTIVADAHRVEQVLVNLLGNAIKFTPAGGSVVVGCSRHPEGVAFHVSDSGPGVIPENVSHVFDRYWHGEASTGVGLGLTIAHDIVEAHGGRIWVENEPGRGAKFVFTLPVAPHAPE